MMVGHGGPRQSRAVLARGRGCWPALGLCCALVLWSAGAAVAGDDLVRVRIAWGGSVERLWHGTISINEGSLHDVEPLGVEADEPGAMWIDNGRVVIHQRSPRVYDGLDLLVRAPLETASLRVRLGAGKAAPATVIEVPLRDVLDDSIGAELDNEGTRLLARRTPGDDLSIEFDGRALVFSPGEEFTFQVTPQHLPQGSSGSREFHVALHPGRGSEVLWEEGSIPLAEGAAATLSVPLEVDEGVYDVVVSAVQRPALRLPQMGKVPLGLKKIVAQRKVQILVLADRSPGSTAAAADKLTTVEEIDPANAKWWEPLAKRSQQLPKLPLPNLPRLWQGPLGSDDIQTRQHPLGALAELRPSGASGDVSWEAYTLPIKRPGTPHILEIEYPSDVPQTLGVSVMEPNAADAMMPTQLDSGIDVAEEMVGHEAGPRMLRHRVIFWPRTTTPIVLMTNHSRHRSAVYGKIRVLAGWDHLPRAFPASETPPQRLMAAYMDRPLFPESFCASEALDAWSRQSLDDWTTFYEGGARMVEYLQHVGMNGLMLSAWADAATIYPSTLLEPTPRYDKGVFFATGQDPVRKDVLEMLFRLFNREQLRLIPALEFATPLPELEAVLRAGGEQSLGMEWVGPDGLTWQQTYGAHQRKAAYYNILHPRVQEAMLDVAREIIENYAKHESFAGLAVQLAGYGYAQLPGAEWGMDDATVARFSQETGVAVPNGRGARRFAQRRDFLLAEANRRQWLTWRAGCVAKFYQRLQTELTAARPDARVYLATANMLAGPQWQQRLRPSLPRPITLADALLESGFDPADYQTADGPILMQWEHVGPTDSLAKEAMRLELGQLADAAGRSRQLATPGSLFFHVPRELCIESFDRKNPYRTSYTQLSSQFPPSGARNRRRFIQSLALQDSRMMFDGGWLMPLGQEDAIRDLVAVYRQLPAVRFEQLADENTQPVAIRWVSHKGQTYAYLANTTPVPLTVTLTVHAPSGCRVESLATSRPVAGLHRSGSAATWQVALEPYDLIGARLSSPEVIFSEPKMTLPDGVQTALTSRIRELGVRAAALRTPPPLEVLANPGFEQGADDAGRIPGWIVSAGEGAAARLEPTPGSDNPQKPGGHRSIRLHSDGPTVSLTSEPFASPGTGRLSMFVWLRVPNVARQPMLQLSLVGKMGSQEFSRLATLGRSGEDPASPATVALGQQWSPFVFQVDDLPLEGLSDLRIGFQLIGPGEAWIDDVQLHHLEFKENELKQLSHMIYLAGVKLQTNQVGECIRLLEGYWPRFLEQNVPMPSLASRPAPEPKPASQNESADRTPGLMERMRNLLPKRLW